MSCARVKTRLETWGDPKEIVSRAKANTVSGLCDDPIRITLVSGATRKKMWGTTSLPRRGYQGVVRNFSQPPDGSTCTR